MFLSTSNIGSARKWRCWWRTYACAQVWGGRERGGWWYKPTRSWIVRHNSRSAATLKRWVQTELRDGSIISADQLYARKERKRQRQQQSIAWKANLTLWCAVRRFLHHHHFFPLSKCTPTETLDRPHWNGWWQNTEVIKQAADRLVALLTRDPLNRAHTQCSRRHYCRYALYSCVGVTV